jgi:nucleoside-diphosphate-sugar epimerase
VVIGARGMLGGLIVRRLAELGRNPVAVSREPAADTPGVEWIQAEIARLPDSFPEIAVVYATGPTSSLAEAIPGLAAKGARRLVAFTSTSLMTKTDSDDDEERLSHRRWAEDERLVIALCEQHQIGWTMLRPTLIYLEGADQNISRLAAIIRRLRMFPLCGLGRGLRQPVHAEDLADAAIAAAASDAAINQTYVLPGGETLSYREMIGRIFDGLGMPRIIVPMPPPLWNAAFGVARRFLPGLTPQMGSRMSKDMAFDGTAAIRDFGWAPRRFQPRFPGQG